MAPEAPQEFLSWLAANPQDVLFTNDVSTIEVCFPYLPNGLLHVIQLHDSAARYLSVAVRHASWVDGVVTVSHHIEDLIASRLASTGFGGIVASVHNAAKYPPRPVRTIRRGPLRLLFMGRLDPLVKGVFDLVPILLCLSRLGVPFALQIVGGRHAGLRERFVRAGLGPLCIWEGHVAHEQCYAIAAENDILLLPSRREPFGMVTIEAMAMGCVPMAYDIVSGSAEIIQPNRSGVLTPLGKFEMWAKQIQRLDRNREELHAMSQAAVLRARDSFSIEALAQRLKEVVAMLQGNVSRYRPHRLSGTPAVQGPIGHATTYHKLAPKVRSWIRESVAPYPRLSCWLLRRWA
jgi:glycosyltransferase involved in cell wall biosynthesis